MENKLLTEIKDEYARERGCSNWQEYHMNRGSKHYIITLDTIATRYAAKENEGLIRDVRGLRKRLKEIEKGFDDSGAEYVFMDGQTISDLLSKTAHYDNQEKL